MRKSESIPELLPRLSRGRHFTPRSGACFMEFASYLAGERWSDHPRCTDPVLGAVARAVNDLVDDDHRARLVVDIPRVVGLRGSDTVGLLVALRAAVAALPVASMDRQRALAVAIRLAVAELDERGALSAERRDEAEAALVRVPDAQRWADDHLDGAHLRAGQFAKHGAVSIVRTAVLGIAEACVPDPDDRLVALLRASIADAEAHLAAVPEPAARPVARI